MMSSSTGRSIAAAFAVAFFATEIRAWRGQEPLGKVFWGYGVGISSVMAAFYVAAIYTAHVALQQVLLVCFSAYTIWILVSVWRCAANTRDGLWGLLARLLTVAWACNTALALTFLQLDLLSRYF